MEGQVGMMRKATNKLQASAGMTTRCTDMCVALAETLIEVGRRSNLPTRSSSYVRPLGCLGIVTYSCRGKSFYSGDFYPDPNLRKSLLYSFPKQSDLSSYPGGVTAGVTTITMGGNYYQKGDNYYIVKRGSSGCVRSMASSRA